MSSVSKKGVNDRSPLNLRCSIRSSSTNRLIQPLALSLPRVRDEEVVAIGVPRHGETLSIYELWSVTATARSHSSRCS